MESENTADQQFADNVLRQVMDLWITPEVVRRQELGIVPRPYGLMAAQVLLHADTRPNEVRLNEEVRATSKVKYKAGVAKQVGDTVYADEIESLESIALRPDDDPNCAHISLIRIGSTWTVEFDFIYNRAHSASHLSAAKEFVDAAKIALSSNSMRAFVDNCFSASELAAKAFLLSDPLPSGTKTNHKFIQSRFNLHGKLGNVDVAHKDAFNRLAALRGSARYLDSPLTLSQDDATKILQNVISSIAFAEARIGP